MKKIFITLTRVLALGVLMVLAGCTSSHKAYPSKPITLIVPYPAGGGGTILGHLIGHKLSKAWGQSVIVDPRPGGHTIIAAQDLIKAPPDGYTLMLAASVHASMPYLFKLPYDTLKDFAQVATISQNAYILVVNQTVAADNLQQFIALAKSEPGKLNYGTVGVGSSAHLAAELFQHTAGIKMQHIPYHGSGPIIPALLSHQIEAAFLDPSAAIPYLKSGKLKAMAISSTVRDPSLPNVPTFKESGLPTCVMESWWGIFAPAHTPKDILNKLSGEISKILKMPDVDKQLALRGSQPFYNNPEQFTALIKTDMGKFAAIIKEANIKISK